MSTQMTSHLPTIKLSRNPINSPFIFECKKGNVTGWGRTPTETYYIYSLLYKEVRGDGEARAILRKFVNDLNTLRHEDIIVKEY